MNYYDNFINRNLPMGINTKKGDLLKSNTQMLINQYFKDSPTEQTITQNNVNVDARTETVSNVRMRFSKVKDDYRKILFGDLNHIINKGDIFNFYNYDWICIDKNNSSSSNICIVARCNYPLKWIDENKNIITQNVVVVNTEINSLGTDNNTTMVVPESRMLILLPITDDTLKLQENNRFMLKHQQAFKCTNIDITSEEGLMFLTVKKDVYNPTTDNDDLHIANYYGNAHNYTINLLNNNSSVSMGNTLQIKADILDNGNIIGNNTDNITTSWIYSSNNTDIISVDANGLITPITVGSGSVNVSTENIVMTYNIQVINSVTGNNYTATLAGSTSDKLGKSYVYNVSYFNNGNTITDATTWTLTNDDGTSTSYATIISSDNGSCTIKITSTYIFTGNPTVYIKLNASGSTSGVISTLRMKLTT